MVHRALANIHLPKLSLSMMSCEYNRTLSRFKQIVFFPAKHLFS